MVHNQSPVTHWFLKSKSPLTKSWTLSSSYGTLSCVYYVRFLWSSKGNRRGWSGFITLVMLTSAAHQTTYYNKQYRTRTWSTSNIENPRCWFIGFNLPKACNLGSQLVNGNGKDMFKLIQIFYFNRCCIDKFIYICTYLASKEVVGVYVKSSKGIRKKSVQNFLFVFNVLSLIFLILLFFKHFLPLTSAS